MLGGSSRCTFIVIAHCRPKTALSSQPPLLTLRAVISYCSGLLTSHPPHICSCCITTCLLMLQQGTLISAPHYLISCSPCRKELASPLWARARQAGAYSDTERRNFGIADDIYAAGLLLAYMAFIPFCEPGSIDGPSLQRSALFSPCNSTHTGLHISLSTLTAGDAVQRVCVGFKHCESTVMRAFALVPLP